MHIIIREKIPISHIRMKCMIPLVFSDYIIVSIRCGPGTRRTRFGARARIGMPVNDNSPTEEVSYVDFSATPTLSRIFSMRHHFVKADCRRLRQE